MNPATRARWILLTCLLASGLARAAEPARHFFLELDIAIERGGLTALLFDFGDGIWGDHAAAARVPPGNEPHAVRLELPSRPIRGLRFDPTEGDEVVLITGMRLLDDRGTILLHMDPRALRPMNNIASIGPEGAGVRVRPSAVDPMLRLDLPPLQKRIHDAAQRPTVGRGTVIALAALLAAMVGAAVMTAWRAAARPRSLLAGAAIFLVVFGLRLLWLNQFSRSVPFWDEWDGDALYILIPFHGGFLDWGALVMPQWEHRILLTRIITLFGTVLNGEWDPRVAMTVSAVMFSATTAVIGSVLFSTRRWSGVIAALILTVAAGLPYDFNNLLWGGQTQMYGLVLLAVCTITLAAAPTVTTTVAIAGLAGGLVSLFTMGAGPVGPGCAAGICLVRAWQERDQRRPLLALSAVFIVPALIGVCLHVSSRAHVPLYATSFAQFQRAFVGVLSWPLSPTLACAALVWLPNIFNAVLILRRRTATPLEWIAAGLSVWELINAIALGYARQYEGPPFDSRFFTPISVGSWASICSSVALWLRAPSWGPRLLALIAPMTLAVGMVAIGLKGIAGARESGVARADQDHRLRMYLATGQTGPLLEKPPHHTGSEVVERVDSPLLQRVLPAPYRRALAARAPGAGTTAAEAGPVTLTVRTLMKIGPAIALLGLLTMGMAVWRDPPARMHTRSVGPTREQRAEWACYAAAVVVVLGWLLVYNHVRRDGLVDEPGHLVDVHHFLDQKSGWPEAMPMLPGYHFIVVSLWKLHPLMTTLTAARWITAGMSLLGLAAFGLGWRRLHDAPAARATLLLAVLPLAQPFTGMIYTDMPALAFVLCAAWAQVSGYRAIAALALIGAVAVRQTNLAWAAFFLAWEWLRCDVGRETFLRRVVWMIGLLAAAVLVVVVTGRLTVGMQHGNDFRPNVATLHLAALFVLVLGLPVWIAHALQTFRACCEEWRARPRRFVIIAVAGIFLSVVLAISYRNPHIWNRELFWEGCSFTLLRNWPLVWIDRHAGLKLLSGVNVVLMAAALARTFGRQPHRNALWLALGFGLLPAFTNSLVEPRYFIPPAAVMLLFLRLERRDSRRLTLWWTLLCALHAPFIARGLSLW